MKCIYHVCSHFYQYKALLLTSLGLTLGILYWVPITYAIPLFIPVFILVTFLKNVLCNRLIQSCEYSAPNSFILYNAGPIWQVPKNLSQYTPTQVIHLIHSYDRHCISKICNACITITDPIAQAALKRAHRSNIALIYEALSSNQQARYIELALKKEPNLLDIAIESKMPHATEILFSRANNETCQKDPDKLEAALKTSWEKKIIPIIKACYQAITHQSFPLFYEALKSRFTYRDDFNVTMPRIKAQHSPEALGKTLIRIYQYCEHNGTEKPSPQGLIAR